jgi:UDP-2,3-diacylglucosamine hydrolase
VPHTLFISDLHLCPAHERSTQRFIAFMREDAPQAEALYILGDLFETWAGDDDMSDPYHQRIVSALRKVADGGTRIFLLHGNRDFLMAKQLERSSGAMLLDDPTLIDLYGRRTVLSHGDLFCTDDTAYQAYRQRTRRPLLQWLFLLLPLALRRAIFTQGRKLSQDDKQNKRDYFLDVNEEAVARFVRARNYPNLIHGHTHRMARHVLNLDGHVCERWVLGDWQTWPGNALWCDAEGWRMINGEQALATPA